MPATTDYLATLKEQLSLASQQKKEALQRQYDRATAAMFDANTGALSYRTDDSGRPLYGTLDVDYQEQQRGINTRAEGAGMLRSGQRARDLATSEAAYRTAVTGLAEDLTAGKSQIDTEELMQRAEYEAMYGKPASSKKSSSSSTSPKPPKPPKPPTPPKPPKPPTSSSSRNTRTTSPTLRAGRARGPIPSFTPQKPPKRGPAQGPSIYGPGVLADPNKKWFEGELSWG